MNSEDETAASKPSDKSSTEATPDKIEIVKSAFPQQHESFFRERPPQVIEVAPQVLRHRTRRDVLLFGVGAIAALAGGGSLLPRTTLERLGVAHENKNRLRRERLLNRALHVDDDVAEALYSRNRLVPTYTKSQITPLKNNYNGATPDPSCCKRLWPKYPPLRTPYFVGATNDRN